MDLQCKAADTLQCEQRPSPTRCGRAGRALAGLWPLTTRRPPPLQSPCKALRLQIRPYNQRTSTLQASMGPRRHEYNEPAACPTLHHLNARAGAWWPPAHGHAPSQFSELHNADAIPLRHSYRHFPRVSASAVAFTGSIAIATRSCFAAESAAPTIASYRPLKRVSDTCGHSSASAI